jgi:hypothetical protein
MVLAAAFHMIICDKSTVQYTLCMTLTEETLGFSSSTELDFANLSGIPSEYHDFTDVFSESGAYNLLPHCEFNLKIETINGAEPLVSPIYLSPAELLALQEFLNRNFLSILFLPWYSYPLH